MPFDGLRVVSFESRRAAEMAELIRRQGGEPLVAPSMRESAIENNSEAFEFAEQLFAGEFDLVIFMTGVGARALSKVLASRYPEGKFAEALRKTSVAARGPKPMAALRDMQVPAAVSAPEPNTWRELMAALEGRNYRNAAVQEYGKSNSEFLEALGARGAKVTAVRVYQWDLPKDTAPLREAVHRIVQGKADVALFTTSIQIAHLLRIAAEEDLETSVLQSLRSMVLASIGPSTTEALEEFGLMPDITPTHPKMGFLVKEAAEQSAAILERKRAAHA